MNLAPWNPVNRLGNSDVCTSTAKLDKREVYELGPCKQKGSNVEIYGLSRGPANLLIQDTVMSIKTVTCNKTKGTMVDGIQRFKSSSSCSLINSITIIKNRLKC